VEGEYWLGAEGPELGGWLTLLTFRKFGPGNHQFHSEFAAVFSLFQLQALPSAFIVL
jgi:hypothetical protein